MMSLWDALRMNMMISYQELVRTFPYQKSNIFSFSKY
ncbi:ydjO [Escherichia coli]|nr:ydjO [Escherichia coli]SQO00268.1 ydjO [Escherichia coli]